MSESPISPVPSGPDAQRALDAVEVSRSAFASKIKTPPGYDPAYALASGMVIAGIGISNGTGHATRRLVACVVLFGGALVVFALLLRYFRATNGVWVSGLRPGRTRWLLAPFVVSYCVLGVVVSDAASRGEWWVFAVAVALASASAYGLSKLWMRVYATEMRDAR